MQWSWLLARLVMSLCFGQVQQLSKMEVEDLLRKGAYGALMDEEDEGSKFCEEDIDQILQRRTQTITIQSEGKGSTFAKVCCAPLGGKGDFLWWGREGNMQGSSGQPTSSPVCGDMSTWRPSSAVPLCPRVRSCWGAAAGVVSCLSGGQQSIEEGPPAWQVI